MDADDVAFGKALLERKQRSADRLRCGRIGEGIMGKYPAAESRQQLGDARADGSQTDQPDSGGALGVPIPPSTGALVAGYRSGGGCREDAGAGITPAATYLSVLPRVRLGWSQCLPDGMGAPRLNPSRATARHRSA